MNTRLYGLMNSYMEGTGSDTVNYTQLILNIKRKKKPLRTETTKLQVIDSRNISSLLPNRGYILSAKAYILIVTIE